MSKQTVLIRKGTILYYLLPIYHGENCSSLSGKKAKPCPVDSPNLHLCRHLNVQLHSSIIFKEKCIFFNLRIDLPLRLKMKEDKERSRDEANALILAKNKKKEVSYI